MKCYNCQTELIWGGDHDCEEDEDHAIVTNLSCPKCDAFHLVYWGNKEEHKIGFKDNESGADGYEEWLNKRQGLVDDEEPDEPEMWKHFCEVDCSDMMIGKGEACNWCGEEENESSS